MLNLTKHEREFLGFFLEEGLSAMGGTKAADLRDDNMSIMYPSELAQMAGISLQAAGGVIASLHQKGLIVEGDYGVGDGEFANQWEWWLSDAGIDACEAHDI